MIEVKFQEKPCGCPRLSDIGKDAFIRLAMDIAVQRAFRANGMGLDAFPLDDHWFKMHWFKKAILTVFHKPFTFLKPSEYFRLGYEKAVADIRISLQEIK